MRSLRSRGEPNVLSRTRSEAWNVTIKKWICAHSKPQYIRTPHVRKRAPVRLARVARTRCASAFGFNGGSSLSFGGGMQFFFYRFSATKRHSPQKPPPSSLPAMFARAVFAHAIDGHAYKVQVVTRADLRPHGYICIS